MKRQFLLLFGLMISTILSASVYAQQNPPSLNYFYFYSTNGQEYFGKYWPERTDINLAISMDQTAKSANSTGMGLFEGCEDLKLRISLTKSVPEDTTIYIKINFTDYSSIGGINTRTAVDLPDSIPIPPGVKEFVYPYKIKIPETQNGGVARIEGYTTYPNGGEYDSESDRANFYTKFNYHVEYMPRTIQYKGHIKLNIKGGSSHIVCSFDGGVTWVKPQEEFTDSYIDKALEAGVIYIKEPNSCHLATIPFGKGSGGIGDPGETGTPIMRAINMPTIPNAIVSREQGTHYVSSTSNFVFTIQPTGANTGMLPVVTTNRTIIPDSEGVKIEDNGDGSYTVIILRVQQAISISVDFATGNNAIDNENKVWTDKDELYIRSATNQIVNIYNTAGALVKTMNISAGETKSIVLPAGFYVVKSENNNINKIILR